MKVLLCFLGLQRTILKTHLHLKESCMSGPHEYSVIYITWKNEDTSAFQQVFPEAHIFKIDPVDMTCPKFQIWKKGLTPHVSWQRTYFNDDICLFRYFQQIYLWKRASEYMQQSGLLHTIDILVRMRTDIHIHGYPVYMFYDIVNNNDDNYVYFANEPRHGIEKPHEGCPDLLFFGKPTTVCKTLEILDYIHKYKHSYLEAKPVWYPTPKWEENIVQPESSLYYATLGEGRKPFYLPLRIELVK